MQTIDDSQMIQILFKLPCTRELSQENNSLSSLSKCQFGFGQWFYFKQALLFYGVMKFGLAHK